MEVNRQCFVFSNLYIFPLTSGEAKTSNNFPFDTFPYFVSLLLMLNFYELSQLEHVHASPQPQPWFRWLEPMLAIPLS